MIHSSGVKTIFDEQSRRAEPRDVIFRPLVALLRQRLQHPEHTHRPTLPGDWFPITRRVEEHHSDVRLPPDFVVEPQFVNAKTLEGLDTLVGMVEKHSRSVFVPLIPESQLQCLPTNFKTVTSSGPIRTNRLQPVASKP
jgi:hypothetical protein